MIGLCAAEVRVIFRLPCHLGLYQHPLAYVHLFKPLRMFDDNVKMFYSILAVRHATTFQLQQLCQSPILSSPVTWFPGFRVVPSTLAGIMGTA